jgi:cyclic beta-1,2-glucan synthetase
MLRLGLVLAVGALASSEANASDRDLAEDFARRLLAPQKPQVEERNDAARARQHALVELRTLSVKRPPGDALLVTLLKRLREREDSSAEALEWIAEQTARLGTTPEDLARRYHLQQAADQVSVGNAITSMRSINNLDWRVFFRSTSHVESIL